MDAANALICNRQNKGRLVHGLGLPILVFGTLQVRAAPSSRCADNNPSQSLARVSLKLIAVTASALREGLSFPGGMIPLCVVCPGCGRCESSVDRASRTTDVRRSARSAAALSNVFPSAPYISLPAAEHQLSGTSTVITLWTRLNSWRTHETMSRGA